MHLIDNWLQIPIAHCVIILHSVFDSLIGISTLSSLYTLWTLAGVNCQTLHGSSRLILWDRPHLVSLLHTHDMPTFKSEALHLVSNLQFSFSVKWNITLISLKEIHDSLCYFSYVFFQVLTQISCTTIFLTGYTKCIKRHICHVQAQLKVQKLTEELMDAFIGCHLGWNWS